MQGGKERKMEIREYRENDKNQIIALILYIQNFDTNVAFRWRISRT